MFLHSDIDEMNMTDLDLNLVRVLVLLYETGSVTGTAEALHVSQPTVSYSLGKLRRHFDDELFRRSRQGLRPTALADQHPRLRGSAISEAQLRAEQHVLVDASTGHIGPKLALEAFELLDNVVLQVGQFAVLPYLIQHSDLVAVVPEMAGRAYAASHP